MLTKEAIELLAQAEAITAATGAVQDSTVAALPDDYTVHDLEKFLPCRRRARGKMATSSVPDFAAYVLAHKEAGAATFIDQERMTATAVLNLGTPDAPGHADNRANLEPKRTAAYIALRSIATGSGLKQAVIAEFLEDWAANVECFNDEGVIAPHRAIAAVRKVTIEALKKLESEEKQLGASRSAFESVQATSTEPLPTTIYFNTVAYQGLSLRRFVMRLSVHTGGDKPLIGLRIVAQELHDEEMAAELAELVRGALQGDVPVLVGTYAAA